MEWDFIEAGQGLRVRRNCTNNTSVRCKFSINEGGRNFKNTKKVVNDQDFLRLG